MFNVLKKRRSYHDDKAESKPKGIARHGAADKLMPSHGLHSVEPLPKETAPALVPNDAQKAAGMGMSHAETAEHHQKLADHFRQVANAPVAEEDY